MKYKVGDRVKIHWREGFGKIHETDIAFEGAIGTIVAIDKYGFDYVVDTDFDLGSFWYEDELELVVE